MNGNKRNVVQKGAPSRHGGKTKEAASSSRQDPFQFDSESFFSNLPLIRTSENAKQVPKYTSILARSAEVGVNMEDLDQLQIELEQLLSTCALRQRHIRAETESSEQSEEKRGKNHEKGSKRTDERNKFKSFRNGARPIKKRFPIPGNALSGRHELPRIIRPKNETSEKFWASVEPYCASIVPAHQAFLEKLIEECSQEVDVKIPEVGEYYANEWNDSATSIEQNLGLANKGAGMELTKNGLNAMVESFSNPTAQRLLAALIEERVDNSFPSVTGKLKPSDLGILKPSGGPRPGLCMDRRIRKDLIKLGILTIDDLPKNETPPEDEIRQEIQKCQQELATVNEYNVQELKRLQAIVQNDLKRQEIQANLEKVDKAIMDMYNKVVATKQKHIDEKKTEMDKAAFTRILKEFEPQTDTLLKQQSLLQKQLRELE